LNSFARSAPWLVLLLGSCAPTLAAQPEPSGDDAIAAMVPYDGPAGMAANASTLTGKVMCGYQGWFTTPADGSGRGWRHYAARGQFKPGSCNIDLWPDVSELDEDEKVATPFLHTDGRGAAVFSSHNAKTVLRHFRWMEQYGIDGAFVQRFAVETIEPRDLRHCNTVLASCREGANRSGRCYAVMYDLSGLPAGSTRRVIADWKMLVDRMKIGKDARDAAYLRHQGKPVVAVWGIGFDDKRKYTLAECDALLDFLRNDKDYGGCTVLVGVPSGWRTLDRDSVRDPALHQVIAKADIVSPWTVGRYRTLEGVTEHAQQRWKLDMQWCKDRGKEYLPVVFPGFSWHNMRPKAPLDEIPRLKGRFLWQQFVAAKQAGATMIYQAMFDEMDEGTAIFKCTDDPPVGASTFLTLEGLPSDHYLWLAGMGGKLLRGEIAATAGLPARVAGAQPGAKEPDSVFVGYLYRQPKTIDFALYTHLCHAFVVADETGKLRPSNTCPSRQLVGDAHKAGVKILISLGGWGWDKQFAAIVSNAEAEDRYVKNVMTLVDEYDYDGIDLDWEYPDTQEEVVGFDRLSRRFRKELDDLGQKKRRRLLETMAASASPSTLKWLSNKLLLDTMDWVNVMTYDYTGSWTTFAGHHSPLFASSKQPGAPISTQLSMKYLLERGMPANRLAVGLPLYGKAFAVAEPYAAMKKGAKEPAVKAGSYNNIARLIKEKGWQRRWDDETKNPWAIAPDGSAVIGYDDAESLSLRTDWAMKQGFRGVFFWEIGGDQQPDGTSLLQEAARNAWAKRARGAKAGPGD
jgi:GH18 family chitinase